KAKSTTLGNWPRRPQSCTRRNTSLHRGSFGEIPLRSVYETIERADPMKDNPIPRVQKESLAAPTAPNGWLREVLPAMMVALAIRLVVVFFTYRDLPDADKHY